MFIAGRIGNSIVVALVMLVPAGADRRAPLRGRVPWDRLPAILVDLVVGAASFCCLGIALTAPIPSQDAAAPIVNAMLLPLYFLSGVFIPDDQLPNGVLHFADVFPIRHFFEAFFTPTSRRQGRRHRLGQPGASSPPGASPASCSPSASSAGRRAGTGPADLPPGRV